MGVDTKFFDSKKKEIPDDFNATNSLFSDNFPNTIMDDKSIDIGNAKGTNLADA